MVTIANAKYYCNKRGNEVSENKSKNSLYTCVVNTQEAIVFTSHKPQQ